MDNTHAVEQHYKPFWDFFSSNLDYIQTFPDSPHMVMDAVSKMLGIVAPDVDFEMGIHPDGYYELILIAGGVKQNIQTIVDLYNSAPEMENWVITPFRQRRPETVFEFYGKTFDPSDFYYQSYFEDGLTHILVLVRGYDTSNPDLYGTATFMLLDTVLGELDVMTRIGEVRIEALPDDLQGHIVKPLSQLADEIDSQHGYDA